MQIFTSKTELSAYLSTLPEEQIIGFTPTMGALHDGHLSLITASSKKCDITICSIFVNPTQFNNKEDLVNYPNTLNADLALLKKANCNIAYAPQFSDMYNNGEMVKKYNFGDFFVPFFTERFFCYSAGIVISPSVVSGVTPKKALR